MQFSPTLGGRCTVSTHSRLKAAGQVIAELLIPEEVSTHSRLKAAGAKFKLKITQVQSFNTQPPEGGWRFKSTRFCGRTRFNTQPPEGGWFHKLRHIQRRNGFNTQPPEGGWWCQLW